MTLQPFWEKNYTVWKFHDFCIIQILREINFGKSGSAKSGIFTHLEALNFKFYEFLHFWKSEIYLNVQIHSPYIGKNGIF